MAGHTSGSQTDILSQEPQQSTPAEAKQHTPHTSTLEHHTQTHQSSMASRPSFTRLEDGSLRRRNPYESFHGSMAAPGRALTRAEREKRIDSVVDSLDGQNDRRPPEDLTFSQLGNKVDAAARRNLEHLGDSIDENFAPNAATHAVTQLRAGHRVYNIRNLMISFTFFILLFGSLYSLVNYSLKATRASAACSTSTVYIPVTTTVTVDSCSSANASPTSEATASPVFTVTTHSTHTQTVTVIQASTSGSISALGGTAYSYAAISGTTRWINGSPSSGASLTTATTTVYLPAPGMDTSPISTITVQSTNTFTATVTPPAYTSTIYSLASPDLTTTSYITQTETETVQISGITTPNSTHATFSGVGSSGWNASSASVAGAGSDSRTMVTPVIGTPTTLTQIYYWGTGTMTTSTSTSLITTTLHSTLRSTLVSTITVSPAATTSSMSVASAAQPTTIMTGQPTTLTYSVIGTGSSLIGTKSSLVSAGSGAANPVTSSPTAATVITSEIPTFPTLTLSTYGGIAPSSPITGTPTGASSSQPDVSPAGVPSTSSNGTVSTINSTGVVPSSTGSGPPHSLVTRPAFTPASGISGSSSVSISFQATTMLSISSTSATLNSTVSVPVVSPVETATSAGGYGLPGVSISTSSAIHDTTVGPTNGSSTTIVSSYSASSTSSTSAPVLSTASSTASNSSIQSTSRLSLSATTNESSLSGPSTTASSGTATPTACGEHGDFMMDFDDLPSWSPTKGPNLTDITQAPPIFDGYHHLAFSNGYVYAPPPKDPFPPVSPPHLAVFLGNATGQNSTPSAMAPSQGMIRPGEIGDGAIDSLSAFWFNAYDAWFGCDNEGPDECTMVFSAYSWSPSAKTEILTYTQNASLPGCPGFNDCHLQQVQFPYSFRGLSGLQMQAYVGNEQRIFFMDNLALGWSNNSCAAGLQRLRGQRGPGPLV